MSEWQPIETAPKDGAVVLLFFPAKEHQRRDGTNYRYEFEMVTASWDSGEWHLVQTGGYAEDSDASSSSGAPPTHWMPLPEAPR